MGDQVQNGNVDIGKIDLTKRSSSGSVIKQISLAAIATRINIYEDITCPLLYAEIDVVDGNDIQTTFPIIGEESIEVQFKTTGNANFVTYNFSVYQVVNTVTNEAGKLKHYTIKCCSQEYLPNDHIQVNRKFTDETFNIIEKLITDDHKNGGLGSKKKYNIEPTKGTQDVLVSKQSPLQTIDLFRHRAVSKKYISNSFCFFENRRGFNFCTVEFLFDEGKKHIQDKVFWYDPKPQTDNKAVNFRNIIAMKNISDFNTSQKSAGGALRNNIRKFDLHTGEVTDIEFKLSEKLDQFNFPSAKSVGTNTSEFAQQFEKLSEFNMLVPHRGDLPDTFIADSLGAKQSFIHAIVQNLYQIHTYGDSELTAGDVITVNIPESTGLTKAEKKANRLKSGNYLISKIRHIIVNDKQRMYTNSMELIKGSYEDNS